MIKKQDTGFFLVARRRFPVKFFIKKGEMQMDLAINIAQSDQLVKVFWKKSFVVPAEYDHSQQIEKFINSSIAEQYCLSSDFARDCNNCIEDQTGRLSPGQTINMVVYQLQKWGGTINEIYEYLKSVGAILVGGHGLTLALQLFANELPWRLMLCFYERGRDNNIIGASLNNLQFKQQDLITKSYVGDNNFIDRTILLATFFKTSE
jgi:hypothetical protein